MIDTVVNAIMLTGIVLVSVPTLTVAVAGLIHLAYGAYKLVK